MTAENVEIFRIKINLTPGSSFLRRWSLILARELHFTGVKSEEN